MKRLLLLILLIHSMPGFAKADPEAGQQKAMVCAACHGKDGNSVNAIWPKLAGQHARYLVKQLQDYKTGKTRNDPSMSGMVANLSLEDMQNLAAFYAQQTIQLETATAKKLKAGERLYRAGDFKKQITACIACHGPRGMGNAEAGFPSLSGQHPQYTVNQLEQFKRGTRHNDLNGIMREIAQRMDTQDMQAVANYISALH